MAVTRVQLLQKLNIIKEGPDLEKFTLKAYQDLEKELFKKELQRPTTSFWASQFPIDDTFCNRLALYNLMNIPPAEPFPANGRAVTEMGKAAEYQIVYRWGKSGLTVGGSVPVRDGHEIKQLSIDDPDTWLSGNIDAVLDLRPSYKSVLPVDIKSKSQAVIDQMIAGKVGYDGKHKAQVLAYVYLCTLVYEDMGWKEMGLLPPTGAVIFYVSRDNPRSTFEFYIPADWDLINSACDRLRERKAAFLFDSLPPRDKDWYWSKDQCKWCDRKKFCCKPDDKADVMHLSDSNAVEHAKTLKKKYDLDKVRKLVVDRWLPNAEKPTNKPRKGWLI